MHVSNREFQLDKQIMVFFLTISLLAVGGIWLLAYSTPIGLGLNDDSIAYIAGARSIRMGMVIVKPGWLAMDRSHISHRGFRPFWLSLASSQILIPYAVRAHSTDCYLD